MPEKILPREISEELKESYIDYAMSVIISRALPDARDGLKPVQRRILFAMNNLGLRANAKFIKSARIVGEVLGKYHPHGDAPVYDALVRMAQQFSLRYPLVLGQGNFGSIDGDPPAQMRYTEAKMSLMAEEMLRDIEKETVDFMPNYDRTQEEPVVLPANIPNLLINGSLGIAVGMATNIPPHNLKEVLLASKHFLQNENATIEDLLQFIKGPDFPTGGIILVRKKDLLEIYRTGRGRVFIRGDIKLETSKRGKKRLVITSLPWQVNKADLVKKIAELVLAKKVEGIKDVRDESAKEGMRIVLDLKPDVDFKEISRKLYKLTNLQKAFYFNLIALEDGIQPKLFNLKNLLFAWLNHRREIVRRRTIFDLNKNKERVHLLEGFDIALANLDKLIKIIRQSKDKKEAMTKMMKAFKLTEKQADAILEMPLRTLTRMERDRILQELKERKKIIQDLEAILRSKKKLDQVIEQEIDDLLEKYSDERLTKVKFLEEGEIITEKKFEGTYILLINTKHQVFVYSVTDKDKVDKDFGKNKDFVGELFLADANDNLYLFSQNGRAYSVPILEYLKGAKYLETSIILESSDKLVSFFTSQEKEIMILTKFGFMKKIKISEITSNRKKGVQMIRLRKDDQVIKVLPAKKDDILLITEKGQALLIKSSFSTQGKTGSGIKGIKLKKGDFLKTAIYLDNKEIILIFQDGYAKRMLATELNLQKRGGVGVKVFEPKYGELISVFASSGKDEVILVDDRIIKMNVSNLPLIKRIQVPKKITETKINFVYKI